jgi:hypothetical protein
MKVFPQVIRGAAFATSWDGRLTTEAQILVQQAQMLLQNARNNDDGDDIRKAIEIMFLFGKSQGWPRPLVLPVAGMISGAIDRRLYGWFGRCFMRVVGAWLENVVARANGMDENAPGWNDYLMAYWMLTGNPEAVEELYCRATDPVKDPALLPTKESAEWMVGSVRGQCAEFDRAYREVEERERPRNASGSAVPA